MSFAIQLDLDQGLINNKLIGEFSPELVLEFFQDLLLKLKHSGIRRVFTDATDVVLNHPLEAYGSLPDKLKKMNFPTDLRRAILVRDNSEINRVWEELLFSKGYQRVRIFSNEQEARIWLMED